MVLAAGAFAAAAAGVGADVPAGVRAVTGGGDWGDDCVDEFGVAAAAALLGLVGLVALLVLLPPAAADVAFSGLVAPAADLAVGAAAGVGVDCVAVALGALLATGGMAVA
ncbi:hypothetical protein B0G83_12213 [Paraburkholderia sp. BL21I4N1]|nr:hypothetical protein B0G83_12213 [Paraburkholderia sp. BL21I4N1]